MRFYDQWGNLRIVLSSKSILYISAEHNYIDICYMEDDNVAHFILRATMKSVEVICQDHDILRCQRSYYVNPLHVNTLYKDGPTGFLAELKTPEPMSVPVTKGYYRRLAEAVG